MAKTRTKHNPHQLLIDFDIIEQDLFLLGDLHNIRYMLPKLYPEQQEDVSFAERRFKEGKGYLFTNGTGTGKTFVGLGIAKRFYVQGKVNILIVVPTDKKCIDWIEDGHGLELYIYKLAGINDAGNEICVTTYANFYQNDAINKRHWDLIIYDESHYLGQNADGNPTSYVQKHAYIANLPSEAKQKAMSMPEVARFDAKGNLLYLNKDEYHAQVKRLVESTKVVFLSATPFAYHKSTLYADGTLWDIYEHIEDKESYFGGYNEATGFDKFLMENFGYRMRTNKITIPETGVDVNLLERNFFEENVKKGIMSTRILQLQYDYSRHFVTVNSEIGDFIDTGMSMFYNSEFTKKYKRLSECIGKKYNYNFINQLLEVIKAKEVHVRVQQHLDMGRKVVIFHGYNNSVIGHPFRFEARELVGEEDMWKLHELRKEIAEFEDEYPEYWNLDLSTLVNTRAALMSRFPMARQFNGEVPKNLRNRFINEFNTDNSMTNIIIVQEKAGREGISMHDKTGVQQRVLINLGLPTAPTSAIQIEGRIYREGVKSNAVYEYITLQTNFEKYAFGDKIAQRSKTAENLAMGNLARDLETAFKEGYLNSSTDPPSFEQGTGGKEKDRFIQSISEFQRAKTYYFARGKRTSKNKAREGIDYFATPEPLGYKMVEWAQPRSGQHGLEPSAGHGGIARFFPGDTVNHFVEPSHVLAAELSVNAKGKVMQTTFENYSVVNSADFIVMNPPFGSSGKTAMEHLRKAIHYHLDTYGRLVAIIPNGPSMQKRLDDFFLTKEARGYYLHGEIILPSVVFERAGTSVSCRIIKIVANNAPEYVKRHDLSYITDIGKFFDAIEYFDF